MRAFALFLAGTLAAGDEQLEAIQKAIENTGSASYAYEVRGRFTRSGEFAPPGTLTSKISHYQSLRHGEGILVKGPEGLWKTPEERLGEKVQNPDKEAPAMVRTLQEAEPPHRMVEYLLTLVTRGREPEDREVDGVPCRRWSLTFTPDALKTSLDQQMTKSIRAGKMKSPDEVRWSTRKGSLVVYASKKDGRLVLVTDERSVQIAYNVPDQQPDVKWYKLEYKFVFSRWGKAELSVPKEVKDRMGIDD